MNDWVVELPKSIKHLHKPDEDVITWSNWKVKQGSINFAFILGGLFVTITGLGFLTYNLFFRYVALSRDSWPELLVFLYLFIGTGLMFGICIYVLLSFTWTDSIRISNHYLSYGRKGFKAPAPKQFSKKEILKIQYGLSADNDASVSSYIIYVLLYGDATKVDITERGVMGEWLTDDDLLRVFRLLKQICQQRGWLIHFEYAPGDY